jgi:hypothetical protein
MIDHGETKILFASRLSSNRRFHHKEHQGEPTTILQQGQVSTSLGVGGEYIFWELVLTAYLSVASLVPVVIL